MSVAPTLTFHDLEKAQAVMHALATAGFPSVRVRARQVDFVVEIPQVGTLRVAFYPEESEP